MSLSVTLAPPCFIPFSQTRRRKQQSFTSFSLDASKLTPADLRYHLRLQASRRNSNFPEGNDSLVDDPRNWGRSIGSEFSRMAGYDDDEDEDDEDDEEEDRSLDLFVKFVQNVFKKISRRARRAVRSVLPIPIPTKLVAFSVNGVLILAFLWVLKAFLEVVCTLGTVVFVSILLIRGIWTGVAYLQANQTLKMNDFDDENRAWNNGAQPVS